MRVLVFLPGELRGAEGVLLGRVEKGDCVSFYVLGSQFEEIHGCHPLGNLLGPDQTVTDGGEDEWVSVGEGGVVRRVMVGGEEVALSSVSTVEYDRKAWLDSELLCSSADPLDPLSVLSLRLKECKGPAPSPAPLQLAFLCVPLSWLCSLLSSCRPVLGYSSLGLHLIDWSHNLLWLVQTLSSDGRVSLKTGNYLLSLLLDVLAGYFVLSFLTGWASPQDVFNFSSATTKGIVDSLVVLVGWLKGSPAGLKLNHPLNQMLGEFFEYNINLWWTFLGLMRPALEMFFSVFLRLGVLGLTFQLAVLADVFTIVTFHVYCVYVYAARLYGYQLRGVGSLCRLFVGRRRNPEPGRVDSCPYTTEQLFVGTIAFTVLLFLLPTTLVYYVVFLALRLCVNVVSGVMRRLSYSLQALPLYTTTLWLFRPQYTAATVRLEVDSGGKVVARPAALSLAKTVSLSLADSIQEPPSLQFNNILYAILYGKLIYPL